MQPEHGKKVKEDYDSILRWSCTTTPPVCGFFSTRIPNRNEWKKTKTLDQKVIDIHLYRRLKARWKSSPLSINMCMRLQAEWLLKSTAIRQSVTIYSDSQAAIWFLLCNCTTLKVAIKCRCNLKKLSTKFNTAMVWIHGHSDIPRNCMADELAKEGTLLSPIKHANNAGLPFSTAKYMLKQIQGGWIVEWGFTERDCATTLMICAAVVATKKRCSLWSTTLVTVESWNLRKLGISLPNDK